MNRWWLLISLMLPAAQVRAADVWVTLLRCPEEHWQQKLAETKPDAAKLLTLAGAHDGMEVAVQVRLETENAKPVRWTEGKEMEFTAGWISDGDPFALKPRAKEKRWMGTVIEATVERFEDEEAVEVALNLRHDTAAPTWTEFTYPVSTVVDPPKQKTPLKLPQFRRIEWQGRISSKHLKPVLAGSLLVASPEDKADKSTRWFVIVTP
ncbi:MAG: hypothetical protein JWO89_470 [Verrucomicrobiaceae bacterium]|nr:hypothetical protein [Verrucomicrobiaceae bacterium]